MSDDKTRPAHYGGDENPFEPIKVIESLGWSEGFCLGNALKYLMRAGKKDGETKLDDLKKARWYLDRCIAWEVATKAPPPPPSPPKTKKRAFPRPYARHLKGSEGS